jgi:superfamily I DNA and RNA helicase
MTFSKFNDYFTKLLITQKLIHQSNFIKFWNYILVEEAGVNFNDISLVFLATKRRKVIKKTFS